MKKPTDEEIRTMINKEMERLNESFVHAESEMDCEGKIAQNCKNKITPTTFSVFVTPEYKVLFVCRDCVMKMLTVSQLPKN